MKRVLALLLAISALSLNSCRSLPSPGATQATDDETAHAAKAAITLHLAPLVKPLASHDGVRVRIPVPPGRLTQAQQLQVLDANGAALPLQIRVLQRWPDSLAGAGAGSPRLLEATLTAPLPALLSASLEIRIAESGPATDAPVATQPLPAVAVLPPQWHVDSFFFGQALPLSPRSHWFDLSMLGFTQTALNALPDSVRQSEYIDFSKPAPWLFDRPGLLFDLYLRSSDVTLMTAAEKESRHYISLLQPDGSFSLKPGDLKYVYPRSLLYRWQLFGEESQRARIEAMARLGQRWPMDGQGAGFWTERHTAYAFGTLLAVWEISGDEGHAAQLGNATATLLNTSRRALANGQTAQCPAHSLRAHEGKDSDMAVCSPWMLALLVEPMQRYYRLSSNPDAAAVLGLWHRYLRDTALYTVAADDPNVKLRGKLLPWYLASNDYTFSDNGPFGDLEHSCDVAAALATTARFDDSDPARSHTRLMALMESCRFNLQMWHRPGSDVQHGKPVWRLSPPRKFNWWFGNAQALTWHLAQGRQD